MKFLRLGRPISLSLVLGAAACAATKDTGGPTQLDGSTGDDSGGVDADVTVTKAGATVATEKVPAGGLTTIYLPWVPELKATSPDNGCGTDIKLNTVRAK